MKFQEVGLILERNCRFKAELRRNSDLLMTDDSFLLAFGLRVTQVVPQKAKAFNFFSFPTTTGNNVTDSVTQRKERKWQSTNSQRNFWKRDGNDGSSYSI